MSFLAKESFTELTPKFNSVSLTSKRYALSFVILHGFAYLGSIALITGKWVK